MDDIPLDLLTEDEYRNVEDIRGQLREWRGDDRDPEERGISSPTLDAYIEDVAILLAIIDRLREPLF